MSCDYAFFIISIVVWGSNGHVKLTCCNSVSLRKEDGSGGITCGGDEGEPKEIRTYA